MVGSCCLLHFERDIHCARIWPQPPPLPFNTVQSDLDCCLHHIGASFCQSRGSTSIKGADDLSRGGGNAPQEPSYSFSFSPKCPFVPGEEAPSSVFQWWATYGRHLNRLECWNAGFADETIERRGPEWNFLHLLRQSNTEHNQVVPSR